MKKIKVLFVCTGNICRSPLAHKLFERIIEEQGKEEVFEIDSCGIGAWHEGDNADARMRSTAQKRGWKLEKYARAFRYTDLDFDYLIAMDRSHADFLRSQIQDSNIEKKIHLIREYDSMASLGDRDVPDPYYGGDRGFEQVYDMLDRSCKALYTSIINNTI